MKPLAVLLSVLVTMAVSGSPERKRPWEWTAEERLAARFDRGFNEKRRSAYAENAARHVQRSSIRTNHFVIEGLRNPELFLPFEVFDVLAEKFRAGASTDTLEGVYPTDSFALEPAMFWPELQRIVEPYVQVLEHKAILERTVASGDAEARERAEGDLKELYESVCLTRVQTLDRARAVFGAMNFDRFLYTRVAPGMGMTMVDAPHIQPTLQRLDRGCR